MLPAYKAAQPGLRTATGASGVRFKMTGPIRAPKSAGCKQPHKTHKSTLRTSSSQLFIAYGYELILGIYQYLPTLNDQSAVSFIPQFSAIATTLCMTSFRALPTRLCVSTRASLGPSLHVIVCRAARIHAANSNSWEP